MANASLPDKKLTPRDVGGPLGWLPALGRLQRIVKLRTSRMTRVSLQSGRGSASAASTRDVGPAGANWMRRPSPFGLSHTAPN